MMKFIPIPVLALVFLFSWIDTIHADEQQFYTQTIEVEGIVIKAPRSVDGRALTVAKRITTAMLLREDIAGRMKDRKAALAIIPRNAYITILPEFAHLRGKNDPNGNPYDSFKVRGAGGIRSQPVTATSEENLLNLKGDPFAAENITCHEFAHAVMNLGFSDEELSRWKEIYKQAKQRNTFRGAFAMTSADEYWAELSQSCFDVNNEINGPDLIRQRDPEAFHFLEAIYNSEKSTE